MKVKVKDCGDKKPTASLLFTVKGVVGHILLDMVDGVIVYTDENIISVLHDNKFDDIAVDDILYVNVNNIFLMFYELIIDYKENKIVMNVRRIK